MTSVLPRLTIEPVSAADEPALRAAFDVEVAAAAVDDRHGPPPSWDDTRRALTHPWPGENPAVWLVWLDGTVVGAVHLSLPTLENRDTAWIDLTVTPAARRAGVGRAVLAAAVDHSRRHGRTLLRCFVGEELDGSSPGAAFAAAAGAVRASTSLRRRLVVRVPDEPGLARLADQARAAATGYSIVQWTGTTHAEHQDDMAYLVGRMSTDAPQDDLHLEAERYDAQRLHENEAAWAVRGKRLLTTAAREDATGRLVAFTAIRIDAQVGWHAWQHDTLVEPRHRGHRLGMLVKAANLTRMRARHPQVRAIDTANAESNPWMVAINEAMGYRPLDRWTAWQLVLPPAPARQAKVAASSSAASAP